MKKVTEFKKHACREIKRLMLLFYCEFKNKKDKRFGSQTEAAFKTTTKIISF
jgi:hypothetical protein